MTDLPTKLAQLDALRPTFGDAWVEAQIAALRAEEAPASQQQIVATTASDNLQMSAGNDALVLREITIAEGGTLVIGGRPLDLPPAPEAIQQALAGYLRTLIERYCFLNLQGLGAGGACQVRIELRAVFVSVRTDYRIAEAALFGDEAEAGPRASKRSRSASPPQLGNELRRWLDEPAHPRGARKPACPAGWGSSSAAWRSTSPLA